MTKGSKKAASTKVSVSSKLRVGDSVMVIAGGNRLKRPNIGQVGRIISFVGERQEQIVIEGLNSGLKHVKPKSTTDAGGRVLKIRPVHLSNAMYYSEKHKRPFRLKVSILEDGTKVRGFLLPGTSTFEQL
jgi:large subunit ribosomal protein L24